MKVPQGRFALALRKSTSTKETNKPVHLIVIIKSVGLPSSPYCPLRSTADRCTKAAWTNGFSKELVSLLSSVQRIQVSDLGAGVWSINEDTPTAQRGGGVIVESCMLLL